MTEKGRQRKILIYVILAVVMLFALAGCTGEIFDKWSLKQGAESSGLGFETGFLDEYDGYHSH